MSQKWSKEVCFTNPKEKNNIKNQESQDFSLILESLKISTFTKQGRK